MQKLLSFKYKIFGLISVGCALVLSVIYFVYGFRISMPVFAVFSYSVESEIFTTIRTNVAEELILLFFIAGFFLISFSKEKNENHCLRAVRIKAVNQTILVFIFWQIFSVLFVFGKGFHSILVLNIILPFVIYLVFFYSRKNKALETRRLRRLQHQLLTPLTDLKKNQ